MAICGNFDILSAQVEMTDFNTAGEMFGDVLLQVCLVVLFAIFVVCAAQFLRKPLCEVWSRSRSVSVALAALASVTMAIAQKRGSPSPDVSVADIARGYRLDSVTTNESAAMPSGAAECAAWSLRGGRETWFSLDLGEFAFPLGTNLVSRLRVLSGGTVETFPPDATVSICAAREHASLIPGESDFRWADSCDGAAKILRWGGVCANRDRTGEYDAEIRLFANGDFTTRSNSVEAVYRRINPRDFDGDGIVNERDLNQYFHDGDFFGVGNPMPPGADTNAYYWLELVPTGALGVAEIAIDCDGPSDLGSHWVIARTNEICRVPLLAGATYSVQSDLPIDHSAVSSEYAQIETNSETSLTVSLPLELYFERVPTRGGSANYAAHTSPVDVLPRVLSVMGGCCSCVTNEMGFSWACLPTCSCDGAWRSLSGTARWEGYPFPFSWLGRCPCYYADQPAIDDIESRGVSLAILDAAGNAIEWRNPILVGESVIVEATVGGPEMTVSDFVGLFGGRVRLKAYYVDSDGSHDIVSAAIPISAATTTSQGQNVFCVSVAADWLQSNGIVRNADEGIASKTSVDMASGPDGGSDRLDSDIFDENVEGRLYGRARGRRGGSAYASVPEGEFNLRAVQAAGTASLVAECVSSRSQKVQSQQQADVFYYSGHGVHDTASLNRVAGPDDVTNYWRDVDTAVFAGCAVLDVGDMGNNYPNPAQHSASPGLKWLAASGAGTLLGYCWTAPLDSQGGDRIVNGWCANRATLGDVEAWMRANDNRNGRNACAIQRIDDSCLRYWVFKREKGYIYNSYSLTNVIEVITR